jgi:hypothetical protein
MKLPPPVHIVDQHDVDCIRAEPLQAVLERAHRAVVAKIERDFERRLATAHARRDASIDRPHQASDLRGNHDRSAVDCTKARAEAVLGQTKTVERRRVEVSQTGAMQMRECARDGRIRILARKAAERCRAHTEQ